MLAFGVVAGLCTIAGIGAYTYTEVRRLRDEQTAISERNRKDSLQLLRIQNALASLAVLMRDMVEGTEPYPLHGWQPAFERVRQDLDEATRLEQALAPAVREPAQQQRLVSSLAAYWTALGSMFAISRADEAQARDVVRNSLIPQQRAIDGLVSQFLVVNNQVQEEAARANRAVYDRVARQILLLVAVLLAVTGLLGLWVVVANRRAFQEVAGLNAQLRTLSWRMLRVQEDVQRSLSRELHDDFGQIVTAIGTLLGRARRHAAGEAGLASELEQVRTIAQQTLDRIRSRSQWLHPGVLDDFGLARALEGCRRAVPAADRNPHAPRGLRPARQRARGLRDPRLPDRPGSAQQCGAPFGIAGSVGADRLPRWRLAARRRGSWQRHRRGAAGGRRAARHGDGEHA